MAVAENCIDLDLQAVIGFSGKVQNGLKYTPCGDFLVYPLGSIIVVKNIAQNKQSFLEGHDHDVSCISISHDGTRLASGQKNHPGVKADVLVWDLDQAKRNCLSGQPNAGGLLIHRLKQHLGMVQDVDFSCDDQYLCTLGGQDDNALVIWDAIDGRAICGSPAAPDSALTTKWLNTRNDRLITAGNYHLRVWQVDVNLPKLHPMDARMGSLRRVIRCIDIQEDDSLAYCGTKTGDVLKVKIDRDPIQSFNDPDQVRPHLVLQSKDRFQKGIWSIRCIPNPDTGNTNVLVGSGDGNVTFINPSLNKVAGMYCELSGAVTSISLNPVGKGFYAGTDQSNRYYVQTQEMEVELRGTCHYGPINDVIFPPSCPDLFLTCSVNDIRIWNTALRQELLRIQVPNLECSCVALTPQGGTIVSGWNDGKIRAFYPESGRLKFVISDAHNDDVTALAVCTDDEGRSPWRLISGGADGRVRVWSITSSHQSLLESMKEHRGAITCIKINQDFSQCVSASADGSCVVWDLQRYVRINALFEPNVFRAVLYHPDESQILTCGSNNKITYWDAYDGTAIRVIDGGEAEMRTLAIERDGVAFVSGGADRRVKVWNYDDGISIGIGLGHSGTVKALQISPDRQSIVSVGSEGAVMIWSFPQECLDPNFALQNGDEGKK